jgi:hypothetical protein
MIVSAVVAAVALTLAVPQWASAQALDQMRHDIREGRPDAPSNSPPSPPQADQQGQNPADPTGDVLDDDSGAFVLAAIGIGIAAPYCIPHGLMADDFAVPGYFLRYPYWHDEPGLMFTDRPYGARERTWQTELAVEYADSFEDLSRIGGRFRLSTTSRIDLESTWDTLWEATPRGNDSVSIGDVDLLFRFAQSPRLQIRSGIGANWFDDHQGAVAGFNWRYAADYFPRSPWHIAAAIDLGELGKAGLVHFRTTAGLTFKRWELYTGYDYRKVGGVHFDGPVAGVQFRF